MRDIDVYDPVTLPLRDSRMPELAQVQELVGDGYLVERELGHGGMSYVYLAQDFTRKSPVAVKILRPEFAASLGSARFHREVDILRGLDHPHILPLYESGSRNGDQFYTMPYVDGPTLRERLRDERQLPLDEVATITREVASALAYAHAHGVIHRDIKPSNILLGADGAMVADFGIARAITVASTDRITASDIAIGTPEYMSPEQGAGEHLDGRADIYALGCVMYEMLAGEPPFTGPTTQAIVARHCLDAPRSLRVVRPSVPVALECLIMRALAKVPADRFATADDLIRALNAVDFADSADLVRPHFRVKSRVMVGVALAAAVSATGWNLLRAPALLDSNRIVVFPLSGQRGASDDGAGEAVATYIGYALDKTRPLKWLRAWDLTDDREQDLSRLTGKAARRLSERARAAYYIDGTFLYHPDSVTVILELHSVRGDSVVNTAGATGPVGAYVPQLGLQAMSDLLEAIVQPGQIDLSSLTERNTNAVANFLLGERDFRRMQVPSALAHYEAAIRMDSALAVAAFKGALTATWLSRADLDTAFINVALKREEYLTLPQALLAKGLQAYLTGDADSAIVLMRSALRADSTLPGAWTLLGEVYARSVSSEPASDSLARDALRRARVIDHDFATTLVLLEEMALRDGDVGEARLLREGLRRAGADTTHASERAVMWTCVEEGVSRVDWKSAAHLDPSGVLDAGRVLARGVAQPACARAALAAVVASDSATMAQRRGALLGLNGLLVAGGRQDELRALFSSRRGTDLGVWQFYLQNAAVGAGFEREASAASDSIGTRYATMNPPVLWHLAGWAGRRQAVPELRGIARALRAKADSSGTRRDALTARLVEPRLTLATGDTAGAITQLRALKPSGARRDIAWRPWEGLGAERLLLAELLAARGEYREAIRVASMLDATEPVPYLLYVRPSLELRLRAAQAAGDTELAARYSERLNSLER